MDDTIERTAFLGLMSGAAVLGVTILLSIFVLPDPPKDAFCQVTVNERVIDRPDGYRGETLCVDGRRREP